MTRSTSRNVSCTALSRRARLKAALGMTEDEAAGYRVLSGSLVTWQERWREVPGPRRPGQRGQCCVSWGTRSPGLLLKGQIRSRAASRVCWHLRKGKKEEEGSELVQWLNCAQTVLEEDRSWKHVHRGGARGPHPSHRDPRSAL